jgi:hypothetical protein
VLAATAAVEYTQWDTERTESDFRKTIEQLSAAINTLRGVFENVPRKGHPLGLYPYENLKEIRRIIGWLGYGDHWSSHKGLAHECITKLWGVMHSALLLEFDRAVPMFPISKYLGNESGLADKLIEGKLQNTDLQQADRERDRLLVLMRKRR